MLAEHYVPDSDGLEGFSHRNQNQNQNHNHNQSPHRPAPSRTVLPRADSNPPFVRNFLRLDERRQLSLSVSNRFTTNFL